MKTTLKKITEYTLIFFVITAVIYLIIGFMTTETNPFQWNYNTRLVFVAATTLINSFIIGMLASLDETIDEHV